VNEPILTPPELKDLLDETLVRLGPAWTLERYNASSYLLNNPERTFYLAITPDMGNFYINGRLRNREDHGRVASRLPRQLRLTITNSSAKVASFLLLRFIPEMEEAVREAAVMRADLEKREERSDAFTQAVRAAAPHVEHRPGGSFYDLGEDRPAAAFATRYMLNYHLGLNHQTHEGRQYVSLSGAVPPEVAVEFARLMEAYLHPEEAHAAT
jgi:hypothetical protein